MTCQRGADAPGPPGCYSRSDVEFGQRVGAPTILIAAQEQLDANLSSRPDQVAGDLRDAASLLDGGGRVLA
jgi:hypothetical protein